MKNLELVNKKSVMLANAIQNWCMNNKSIEDKENIEKKYGSLPETDGMIQRWMERREFHPYQFIMLLGMGTGKCIKSILEHMKEESILIIYEPYQANGYHMLYQEEFYDILSDDRVQIIVEGLNEEEFSWIYAALMTDLYNNQICFWQHPCYLQLSEEVVTKYQEHIENGREYRQILNNSRELFSKDYHRNIVHGTWGLQKVRAAEDLKKIIPKDTLVVLVAAGPSLENELQVLRKQREKIVIVAVYRVVDYLLEQGITPDFITTIDSHQKKVNVDEEKISKIPMILPEICSIEVWEHHRGVKFIGAFGEYCSHILKKCGAEINGFVLQPSVAAWQLLIMATLGVERIVLVGQDLAYYGENSHIGGIKEKGNYTGEKVEGIDGTMLTSRGDWLVHKQAIENIIQCYPKTTVYDAKAHGAKIKYTINENLNVIIDKYGNNNRRNIGKEIQKLPFLLEGEALEKYKAELEYSKKNIDIMLEKSNRMIFLAKSVYEKKNMKSQAKQEVVQEISEINMWMDEQKEMEIIEVFVEAQTMDLADKLLAYSEDKETEEYNTYLYLQEYYKYIVMGLEEVKKAIDENM